jgi:hypothetical protein
MTLRSLIYEAQYPENLRIWDRNPLILPLWKTSNGLYGLNFHYIPSESIRTHLFEVLSMPNNLKWKRIKYIPNVDICLHKYLFGGIIKMEEVENPIKTLNSSQGIWINGQKRES